MLCGNDSVLLSPQSQNEEAIVEALALSCNSAEFLSRWSAFPTPFPNPETAAGETAGELGGHNIAFYFSCTNFLLDSWLN